jgi:hypothetical protein
LVDFCADCRHTLGEFGRGDAIARYALVVQPRQLLKLAGF